MDLQFNATSTKSQGVVVIVVILSTRKQYNNFNIIIKRSNLLLVDYLKTTQKASATQSTLQYQPIIIRHYISPHEHTIRPYSPHCNT